jgi:UDP-4-amino-4,6-dideoxy-N-acetyl-beta-L-altrosamine N-acetyltransferase
MIEGKRVQLRPMEVADADDVLRWRSDPEILQQLFAEDPPTREGHLRWFANVQERDDRLEFIIIERVVGRPIGTIGLSNIDRKNQRAEFGILIGEADARRKGYGREASELILRYAFDDLGLHRVYLQALANNALAIKLYESLNFQLEGILRQHVFKRGAFRDVVVMAILRAEPGQDCRFPQHQL